jgi:hypothetical protein
MERTIEKVVIFQFASIDGIEYFFYYDGSDKLRLHPFFYVYECFDQCWAAIKNG